jgi:hypothetical protein
MAAVKKTPEATEAEKPAASAPPPTLDQLVKQLQSMGDYAERKAFYLANPLLATVISPINFP